MNKNNYHRYLKLPFEYLKPRCFNKSYDHPNMIYVLPESIDNSVIKWIESFDLKVSNLIEGFYTPTNGGKIPLHNDTSTISNAVKINFTWGPDNSVTRWWHVKQPEYLKPVKPDNSHISTAGVVPDIVVTDAYSAREEDCDLVHEQVINKPSLMNIGQLHSTYNPDMTEDRWTLCFNLLHPNGRHVEFEEALEIFESFIDE
jgi:hypothetical protein